MKLLKKLERKHHLHQSKALVILLEYELVMPLTQMGVSDKKINQYLREILRGNTEDVIWDIGEVINSNASEALELYLHLQGLIYDYQKAMATYKKKKAETNKKK